MTKACNKKLANQSGETLAETLVAMLVAGLSVVMLSMAIAAGSRIIMKTRDVAQSYASATNELVEGGSKTGSVAVTSSEVVADRSFNVNVTEVQDLPGGNKTVSYRVPVTSTGEG